jgi:hypothetical protein
MELAIKAIKTLGGELLPTDQFTSINNKFHAIIIVRKIAKTSHLYPRE